MEWIERHGGPLRTPCQCEHKRLHHLRPRRQHCPRSPCAQTEGTFVFGPVPVSGDGEGARGCRVSTPEKYSSSGCRPSLPRSPRGRVPTGQQGREGGRGPPAWLECHGGSLRHPRRRHHERRAEERARGQGRPGTRRVHTGPTHLPVSPSTCPGPTTGVSR